MTIILIQTMEWIYLTITGLSILASGLAWIAKLKWSQEFRLAKEAEIIAIKEHCNILKEKNELLKEYNSDKIMTLYRSTKEGLETLNESILAEKENLEIKIKQLEKEVERLTKDDVYNEASHNFTALKEMTSMFENSITDFSNLYSNQIKEITESIEDFKNSRFKIAED